MSDTGTTDRDHLSEANVPVLRDPATLQRHASETTRSVRVNVLLPLTLTFVTVSITAGLATALLVWLVTHHAAQGQTVLQTLRRQRAFIVDEGTKNGGTEARLIGLTISTIAVSIMPATQLY